MPKAIAYAGAALIALLAAGCNKPKPAAPAPTDPPAAAAYLRPPELTLAARDAHGVVSISGTARPGAQVRLAAPDGSAMSAGAGPDGNWTMLQPASDTVHLISISEDVAGRTVRARGYVAILPAPGPPAMMLRPASGAEPIMGPSLAGSAEARIVAVDYDRQGSAVVSGVTAPGASVRATLDGAPSAEGAADSRGVFHLILSQTLTPGAHAVRAETPAGGSSVRFAVSPPDVKTLGVSAVRQEGLWRLDWTTPGGAPQATLVLDPAGAPG